MRLELVQIVLFAWATCIGGLTLLSPLDSSALKTTALDAPKDFHFNLRPRPRRALNDPSSTDLAIRSPGTVGAVLDKRFLWGFLAADLLWKGIAATTALVAAGCTISAAIINLPKGAKIGCAVGATIGALGSIGAFITAAQTAGTTAATQTIVWQGFLMFNRRGEESTNSTSLDPAVLRIIQAYQRHRFHHALNGSVVWYEDIMNATRENPLQVYGAGRQMMPWNYTLWAEPNPKTNRTMMMSAFAHPGSGDVAENRKRQDECVELDESGDDLFCGTDPDTNSSQPDLWYTGVDIYGSATDESVYNEDLGIAVENFNDNEFVAMAEDVGDSIDNNGYWDTCLCGKANGNWIFTGSLQASWNDGPYNGFSPCFNPDCDGA